MDPRGQFRDGAADSRRKQARPVGRLSGLLGINPHDAKQSVNRLPQFFQPIAAFGRD